MSNFKGSNFRKNISTNGNLFDITGQNPEGKRTKLVFHTSNSKMRIYYYPNMGDNEKVEVNMPISQAFIYFDSFMTIIEEYERALRNNQEVKPMGGKIEVSRLGQGGWKEGTIHSGNLMFGINANGIAWTSLIVNNQPKIEFHFGDMPFVKIARITHASGEDFTEGEISRMYAKSRLSMAKAVFSVLAVTEFVEPKPKDNNKGGYNNRNNNNQNKSAPNPNSYASGNDVEDDDWM